MIDGRIKLRHISCFLEVASRAGFGRAAEALNLTQPAVSRAIAELEEILGAPLFDRGRSGAVLTAEGRAFRTHAGAAFVELSRGIDTLRHPKSGRIATLSVGTLPTVARAHPATGGAAGADIRLRRRHRHRGRSEWVAVGRTQAGRLTWWWGAFRARWRMMGLAFEHLYSEPIVFVARPHHPAHTGHPVSLADIIRHPLILPGRTSIIRPEIDRLFLLEGIRTPAERIETTDPSFRGPMFWPAMRCGPSPRAWWRGISTTASLCACLCPPPSPVVRWALRPGQVTSLADVELFFNAVREIARGL